MAHTLYVIPGSHPAMAVELMLKRKGLPYKRRDLINAMHIPILRALGFAGNTVPALRWDDEKVQGSTGIARFLETVQPEPALFPSDPERRRAVEAAEAWGDDELQTIARRITLYAMLKDRSAVKDFLKGYKVGLPTSVAAATAPPVLLAEKKIHHVNDDTTRQHLEQLPAALDHVDELIADGVIGGEEPNAADFQIATSLRLLMTLDQLRPLIEARPAGKLAVKLAPDFGAHIPSALPAAWVPAKQPAAVG